MHIEVSLEGQERILQLLHSLNDREMQKAVAVSAKRAATAARTEATKRIRQIYTIKSGDMKARAKIESSSDGAILRVRGSMEEVAKYSAKQNRRGVFVSIKRGNRAKVPRGFKLTGKFVAREGNSRYPIRALYGPAVPQLFGNPEVVEAMQERGGEVFETRLTHEIRYRLGV